MIRLEMWGIACALVLAPWAANAQPADPFEARMAYALNQASVEGVCDVWADFVNLGIYIR